MPPETAEQKLEIDPQLISQALTKAFSDWDVARGMSKIAGEMLASVLKDVLTEMKPKIHQSMKDALQANLNHMVKEFVKQMRDNY